MPENKYLEAPSSSAFAKKLYRIRRRCEDKKSPFYKWYGGRGIKCLLKREDIEFLWNRDKADKLKRPSIDRIDNDGNYTLENCRFIELSENVKRSVNEKSLKRSSKDKCIRGHCFTDENTMWVKQVGGTKRTIRVCKKCRAYHYAKWPNREAYHAEYRRKLRDKKNGK